ncbi:D-alanyl-D-alanine carboxypeptidase family protein [Candidatus Saccharibacteria bacterium]|nr:D-alanyl-D-alanine carboxypeptidase family protein [Candidatus Saccharibacteria bacterium]
MAPISQYGFILHCHKDKEDNTEYAYEPRHLRYIDDLELVTKITKRSLTSEKCLNAS